MSYEATSAIKLFHCKTGYVQRKFSKEMVFKLCHDNN